jgi:RHS repeat-associated protein
VYTHVKTNLPVTNNGYLYIYVSNETPNIDVFFDNLQVTHTRGPLLEETHYYPWGLVMAGISSKALKSNYAENRYKANGGTELQNNEFSDGSGLEMYETTFRGYDAQTGRFMQQDPLADFDHNWSPYSFVHDNPVSFADPLGLADSTKPVAGSTPATAPVLPEAIVTACKPCGVPQGPIINTSAALAGINPEGSITSVGGVSMPPISYTDLAVPEQSDYKWYQYQYWENHQPGADMVYEINKFNPLANLVDGIYTFSTGHDSYGIPQSNTTATVQIMSVIPIGRVSSVIVNATEDISLMEIRQGIASTLANPNSIAHILASKHNLDFLLSKAGSGTNIIKRLYLSLGKTGTLPAAGVFEKVVNIYGYDVTIRGAVVDGVPRIGTAFIP